MNLKKKRCMSIILDPLLDVNPDAYQVALIKKILDKIKMHDDGLSISAVNGTGNGENNAGVNKLALQKLMLYNRVRD